MADPVHVAAAADGTMVYRIDHAPSELPCVRGRDILAAWDSASDAARAAARGACRTFHFQGPDGSRSSLTITDRDARCWAGAADRIIAMHTSYGLSVFLRLLALLDMLARYAARCGVRDIRGAAERHPTLLRLAAEARLTDDARFDESRFLPVLGGMPATDLPIGAPLS